MTTATNLNLPWNNPAQPPATTADTAHKVLIGILVLVVVLMLLVEGAGESHEWGVGIGLLLLGPLLILGMEKGTQFSQWASGEPYIPPTS